MKGRLLKSKGAAVSAMALLLVSAFPATGSGASRRATAPEPGDTTVRSATKSLIESFGELSRTAGKLSETALKLIEAQELLDEKQQKTEQTRKKRSEPRPKVYIEPDEPVFTEDDNPARESIPEQTPRVYIEDTPSPADSSEASAAGQGETELGSLWELPQQDNEGGRYIWIPDEKAYIVESVLNGTLPKGAYKRGEPDLNELTYWRGDSIPMAIPTRRLGRYDRKLYNWLIYPKGLWHIGLSANYGELSTQDSEFLSLIDDVDMGGTIYSIKPSVSYFLRNNLCLGMRLAYTRGKMGVDSFKVDIDEDMSFNLHDINYISENYTAALFLQQYFGLSRRGRFAVYNEIELSVGSGNIHFSRPFNGDIRETRTRTKRLNINYSPGVSIMVMKNAAFNLQFGVFGFHVRKDKQWENGEESGDRVTSGINFRFNIFNISFGVSVII